MPASNTSLYNSIRKKFRARRGEDTGGSPGDPARGGGKCKKATPAADGDTTAGGDTAADTDGGEKAGG